MTFLLDTGVILRLADETDLLHQNVGDAVNALIIRGRDLFITTQNIAEFWNVATRPKENNGKALPPEAVARLFDETIAPACGILTESRKTPDEFKRLLVQYNVTGKQVHDARLVAVMLSWKIEHILTLNPRNFRRFEAEGISVIEPAAISSTS